MSMLKVIYKISVIEINDYNKLQFLSINLYFDSDLFLYTRNLQNERLKQTFDFVF